MFSANSIICILLNLEISYFFHFPNCATHTSELSCCVSFILLQCSETFTDLHVLKDPCFPRDNSHLVVYYPFNVPLCLRIFLHVCSEGL